MGTYFHGNPEIQPEGLQTLVLMNPGYLGFSESQPYQPTYSHAPHFPPTVLHSPNDLSSIPISQYNLWKPVEPFKGRAPPRAQQGLSLSLSSNQPNINNMQTALFGSKYLRAAQQLLDEVVSVGMGIRIGKLDREPEKRVESSKQNAEISMAERHEIRVKKAKLMGMLDEVEQRYNKYHNQMQIVISTFEQLTGIGSAKSYTSLALHTISKQFRSLKDAICVQIRAANNSIGEDDAKLEGSRLKYVDNQIRQQRAFQQLGMMQHNAWRPQRGLPERAVTVLRAWLFEHFLHPYPKDSDKHMLANQTGLTRSQVSNWFINARVRLWKPMVEEMYLEEIKDQNHSEGNKATPSEDTITENHDQIANNTLPKKLRTTDSLVSQNGIATKPTETNPNASVPMKFCAERDDYSMISTNYIGGFGSYPIDEIGRLDLDHFRHGFSRNGGVSLTLGLPHCENNGFQIGGTEEYSEHAIAYDERDVQSRFPPHGLC